MSDRRLWIDTTGKPVITTTQNGTRNARRWGWTEAKAVPTDRADHEKADAWDEGYRSGISDERTAASLGRPAEPNRNNPYREKGDDRG